MKHLLINLFIIGLSTLAFAQSPFTVKFNDSGFDYYAKGKDGVRTGYVQLGYAAGALTVSLSDAPSPLKIEYAQIKQAKDANGTKIAWKKGAIVDRVHAFSLADGLKQGVSILHKNSYLANVKNAYDAALSQLGFTGSTEANYPNTEVDIYKNSEGSIRVVFTREGADINVRMTQF